MSEQQPGRSAVVGVGNFPFLDPFAWWKQLYEANEATWARTLEGVQGTNAYAEALGRYLQSYLELQDLARRGVERYLETLNIPSRNDVARIAEQVIALESKIDDFDFKLDDLTARADGGAGANGSGDGGAGERIAALEAQVLRLDEKLDRVLVLLEQRQQGSAVVTPAPSAPATPRRGRPPGA
ncbi:MAG: hypothetical protein M3Q65_17425, partial [Chloroflexota bacterium]|nr:hypothetical protein [Chloroflexota bacterium]